MYFITLISILNILLSSILQFISSLSINLLNQHRHSKQQIEQLLSLFHSKTSLYQSKVFIVHNHNEYNGNINNVSSYQTNQRLIDIFHWINGYYSMYIISIEYQAMLKFVELLNNAKVNIDDEHSINVLHRYLNRQYLPLAMYLFDSSINPYYFIELSQLYIQKPLKLKDFLYKRQQLEVKFTLSIDYPYPIELKWIHFKGNTQILSLHNHYNTLTSLIIKPGKSTVQYTNGGHVYAIMKLINDDDDNNNDNNSNNSNDNTSITNNITCNNTIDNNNYMNKNFTNSIEFHRILGLYMIPTTQYRNFDIMEKQSNYNLLINPLKYPLFNINNIVIYNKLKCNCINDNITTNNIHYYSNILKHNWILYNIKECFQDTIMNYWESQRLSQVYINAWAVPSINTTTIPSQSQIIENNCNNNNNCKNNYNCNNNNIDNNTININPDNDIDDDDDDDNISNIRDLHRNHSINTNNKGIESLWALFTLPSSLLIQLKDIYHNLIMNNHTIPEPPISLVFNQHYVSTYYIPIPYHIQLEVNNYVHDITAQWLNVSMDSLAITSSYGFREYRKHSIVRWHVDPVSTQPLTAIIHIQHNHTKHDWALQIPKTLDDIIYIPTDFSILSHNNNHNDNNNNNIEWYNNIYLKEGQGILLQSAKLPHARIYKYHGYSYINIFVHLIENKWLDQINRIDLN